MTNFIQHLELWEILAAINVLLLLCLLVRNRAVRRIKQEAHATETSLHNSIAQIQADGESRESQLKDKLTAAKAEVLAVGMDGEKKLREGLSATESKYHEKLSRYKNNVVERYRQRIEAEVEIAQRSRLEFKLLFLLNRRLSEAVQENLERSYQLDLSHYKDIAEVEALNVEFNTEHDRIKKKLSSVSARLLTIKSKYADKKEIYNRLIRKISEYEEDLEFMEYGVYKPHFSYMDLDDFKSEILSRRQQQKDAISSGIACVCNTSWHVNNSYSQGEVMVRRETKLMLRAFNGECDAAIAKATWNNATTMEDRINRAFRMINKLAKSNQMELTEYYRVLKLEEFRLHYENQLKIQEEKEEQRALRDILREEQKLERDVERAKAEAEKADNLYQRALKQAEKDLIGSDYVRRSEIERTLKGLENQLQEALEKKERALSQAQQTRAGHVYIISNIGCFGDDVYKIGMTRRLEPVDRVRELSGASVPFPFDVHGMIYSEDAPALEHHLHQHFEDKRVNMLNSRKEFFRVSLSELQVVINDLGLELKLTKIAEAQQYRQTQAMLSKQEVLREEHDRLLYEFPDSI